MTLRILFSFTSGSVTSLVATFDEFGGLVTNDDGAPEVTSGGAGGAQLEGGITVEHVNLMLAGIYLAMKEQEMSEAEMEAAQAKNGLEVPESNEIIVKDAEDFTYYGTAQGDDVVLNLQNVGDVTIDSGAGDDKLDVTITQAPNISIDTGNMTPESFLEQDIMDEVEGIVGDGIAAGINGIYGVVGGEGEIVDYSDTRAEINIDTGAGDDELELTVVNSTEIILPNSGEDTTSAGGSTTSKNITVNVDLTASNVAIDTGSGADTVTISGGMELDSIRMNRIAISRTLSEE